MKLVFVSIILTVSIVWPAFADQSQAVTEAPLTLADCQNIQAALRALDSYQGTDKSGSAAQMQYKLGSLRMTIALDETALQEVIVAADRARVALVKELLPNGMPAPGTPEYTKFVADDPGYKKFVLEYQKILDTPQTIKLSHISIDALNVGDAPDKNPIPPSVLAILMPIIDK